MGCFKTSYATALCSFILCLYKLNELQRLKQGSNSVEDYYQELQTGLVRCGLVETEDAMMARFLGGLNRDIQDILDNKEYNSITRLFHFACKAEREV